MLSDMFDIVPVACGYVLEPLYNLAFRCCQFLKYIFLRHA